MRKRPRRYARTPSPQESRRKAPEPADTDEEPRTSSSARNGDARAAGIAARFPGDAKVIDSQCQASPRARSLRVAQRNRQSIGSIGGLGNLGKIEQGFDHQLNLLLGSSPISGHTGLHLTGRITVRRYL